MTFRVDITARASRDLERIYRSINVGNSTQARAWFNGLESLIFSLAEFPERGAKTPEKGRQRQVLFGHGRNVYRIIYVIDDRRGIVNVIHIRLDARKAFASKP